MRPNGICPRDSCTRGFQNGWLLELLVADVTFSIVVRREEMSLLERCIVGKKVAPNVAGSDVASRISSRIYIAYNRSLQCYYVTFHLK